MAVESIPEELVLFAVTMGGIADNGVKNVLHMPPQLVLAAGFRAQFDQRIASRLITADGIGELHRCQPVVDCDGLLWLPVLVGSGIAFPVHILFERVVDPFSICTVTAYHGQVALAGAAAGELFSHGTSSVAIQCKEKDT